MNKVNKILILTMSIFLILISFVSASPIQTCYSVHGAYENITSHGMARTFDNVTFAISDVANLFRSEYKWKAGGTGAETPPANTNWTIFQDKQDLLYNHANSSFFTDIYLNDTLISGTVYVSSECKDNAGEGQFNWTLHEYNPSNGIIAHTFGSQVWNGTGADDPIDSELNITNHTVSEGNRLLLLVYGKLDAVPITGELKFKVDEAGTETATTTTTTRCSNIHSTYKSFLVLVLEEEIILDNVAPSVFDLIPIENSSVNIDQTIEISSNVTDISFIDTVLANVSFPNGSSQLLTLINSSFVDKYNVSFLIPNVLGRYNITFIANDSFGNVNNTETTYFNNEDNEAPLVNGLIPIENTTYDCGNTIEISANVTDLSQIDTVLANISFPNGSSQLLTLTNNTFLDKYNASFVIPALPNIRYNVTFFANDSLGNTNYTETTYFNTKDDEPPSVFDLIPANTIYFNVSQTIGVSANVTDNCNVEWVLVNITYPNNTVQQLTLIHAVGDKYNNSFFIPNLNGAYILVFIATATGNYSQNSIFANVTTSDDNLDSVIIYLYNSSGLVNSSSSSTSFSINFTGLTDGAYYLNASVNDSSSNSNLTETRIITATGNYSQNSIFANVTTSDDNLDSVIIYLYNSSGLVNSSIGTFVNFSGLVDGTYYLNASANDTFGNENSTETRTIVLDTTAPLIDIISPLNQSYNNATILINISSAGDNTWYNWNGTNITYTTPIIVTFSSGVNALFVYANDSVGNFASLSVNFIIDLDGPVISLISPINYSTVTASSTIDFEYNVTDNSLIENCSLIINGNLDSTSFTILRNITQSFSVVFANGDYNWSINCTDNVNNENSSETENFTLNYVAPIAPISPTGVGWGGGGTSFRCLNDSWCGEERYCLSGICYDYECSTDADCNDTKTCWMHRCVKLFDMKIEDVDSPIFPGESFGFTYFLKGVAEIHGDVTVRFWLEKDGIIVTEGFDTIYMADFEEKTESTELFLPATIPAGTYNFYAEVNYDSYYAKAGRVIDVGEILREVEGDGFLAGRAILNIDDFIKANIYFILVIVGILILFVIVYWERREIRKALIPESRRIKRHKISIGTFLFFVVLAGISFYANKAELIKLSPLNISFVKSLYIIGLVAIIIIIFSRVRIRNVLDYFLRFIKSLFLRRQSLKIRKKIKIKSFKPKIRRAKHKIIPVKIKVRHVKIKSKPIKKKIVPRREKMVVRQRKKRKHVAGLLEKSHPKLYRELKIPTTKLSPKKVKLEKRSEKLDREIERAKSMREKISSIDKKNGLKDSHPNLKKELKEIKSLKTKSLKSKKLSSEDRDLLKKPHPRIDEDLQKIKPKMSRFK